MQVIDPVDFSSLRVVETLELSASGSSQKYDQFEQRLQTENTF